LKGKKFVSRFLSKNNSWYIIFSSFSIVFCFVRAKTVFCNLFSFFHFTKKNTYIIYIPISVKDLVKDEERVSKNNVDNQKDSLKSEVSKNKSKAEKWNKQKKLNVTKATIERQAFIDKHKEGKEESTEERVACRLSLEYLKRWKESRSDWSFQKVRQIWLLKHMYDLQLVSYFYNFV